MHIDMDDATVVFYDFRKLLTCLRSAVISCYLELSGHQDSNTDFGGNRGLGRPTSVAGMESKHYKVCVKKFSFYCGEVVLMF